MENSRFSKMIGQLDTRQAERVAFFVLGMMFMTMSSTYTMWLGDKYDIVEHKISYTNVVSYVPEDNPSQETLNSFYAKVNNLSNKTLPKTKRCMSLEGIDFIKSNEGIAKRAYWDVNGITVGWGHKINADDPEWLKKMRVGDWLSKSNADYLFARDIVDMVNPGIQLILRDLESHGIDTEKLSQGFIDGLGDLIYNCGLRGVMTSEFYTVARSGDIKLALKLVPKTRVYCQAHVVRRSKTYSIMASDNI